MVGWCSLQVSAGYEGGLYMEALFEQAVELLAEGRSFVYEVQTIETLEPTDIEDMLSDEWNLTLFTCTSSGQTRIAIRCLRAD